MGDELSSGSSSQVSSQVTTVTLEAGIEAEVLRREGGEVWVRVTDADWKQLVDKGAFALGSAQSAPLSSFSPLSGEPIELRLAPASGATELSDAQSLNDDAWVAVEVRQPVELPPDLAQTGGEVHIGARRQAQAETGAEADATGAGVDETGAGATRHEPLFAVVRRLLDGMGAEYQQLEDHPVLQVSPEGDNGSWEMFIEVRDDDDLCLAYSTWQGEVPEAQRDAMLRFVNRANGETRLGSFVLDSDSGVVSYRTGIDVARGPLSDRLLSRVLFGNIEVFDDHLPAIEQVAGGADPDSVTIVRHR